MDNSMARILLKWIEVPMTQGSHHLRPRSCSEDDKRNWWRRRESNPCRVLITRKLLILGKAKRAGKARKAN
jgi:hypothetical protein